MVELRCPGPLQVQHRVRAVLLAQEREVVHAEAGRGVSHVQFLSLAALKRVRCPSITIRFLEERPK